MLSKKRTRTETTFITDSDNEKYWNTMRARELETDNNMGLLWRGIVNGKNKAKKYDNILKHYETEGITQQIQLYIRQLNIAYTIRVPNNSTEGEAIKLLCYAGSSRGKYRFNKNHLWNKSLRYELNNNIHWHGGFYRLQKELQKLEFKPFMDEKVITKIRQIVYKKLRVKRILFKFYNKLRKRITSKSINDVTIHLENVTDLEDADKYEIKNTNKNHFTFSLENLSNIIKTSILHANPENKLIPDPQWPINPYNRTPFSTRDFYGIYSKLKKTGRQIPMEIELLVKAGCDLNKMLRLHRKYFTEHSSLNYVKELEIRYRSLIMDYIRIHNERRPIYI